MCYKEISRKECSPRGAVALLTRYAVSQALLYLPRSKQL